jgi:hypothetical protein
VKVCFITTGPIEWASARLRAYWVAECMEDAVVINGAKKQSNMPEADVYIFQKAINLDMIQRMKEAGKQVWWDLCDPTHWFSPAESRRMIALVNGVVASNRALAADLKKWSGRDIHVIPDRLKISHYYLQREHRDADPIRFIWYGSAQNRWALGEAFIILERLRGNGFNVEMTIMDDKPQMAVQYGPGCPTYYVRWQLDREVQTIANHDIAMIPDYPGDWGKVKSNNKRLTASACGLPVIASEPYYGSEESGIEKIAKDWQLRDLIGRSERRNVKKNHRIEQSARDWEKLLCAS